MSLARLIRAAGSIPLVSVALRHAANSFAEGSVIAMRAGHGRGLLWKRSHRYVNGYWIGQHELELQDALARLLTPEATFYDIGANAGFFALLAAARFAPKGKCIAVEPDPVNCHAMKDQAELNHLTNWTIVQQAVAEAPGKASFARCAESLDRGALAAPGQSSPDTFDVEITTIDAMTEKFGAPTLIKLDVEGAEARAIRGAQHTIEAHKPTWVIELHSDQLAVDVGELLGKHGYLFTQLDGTAVNDGPLPHHVVAIAG